MNRIRTWAAELERFADRPGARPLVGTALSLAKTAKTGHWHWFHYDRRGWWTNRQHGALFFSPTVHTATLSQLSVQVRDFWCHHTALNPGNVVVDVGAGVGDHVLVFARRVGSTGQVIAIEAHPATARCLKLTIEGNLLQNTHLVEEAAWDCEATLQMSDHSAHEGNAVDSAVGSYSVRARPIDDILRPFQLERIDLLKMNIEGAETKALAGMTETLAKTRAIVVSCHDFLADSPDDFRRTKAHVIPTLERAGFSVTTRPDAPYSFMRDYVYARRIS